MGIKLPDTVNIEITELEVIYSVEDASGNWWLMNDQGKIVDQTNSITAKDYIRVLGFRLEPPEIGGQAVAKETQSTTIPVDELLEEGETVPEVTMTTPVGATQAERLRTALIVLQQLSQNRVAGLMDSVDVSSLTSIQLWYDGRFQVDLGDTGQLEYKIRALEATIDQMESYESGHLDLSFKNWPDKVGYTPFE